MDNRPAVRLRSCPLCRDRGSLVLCRGSRFVRIKRDVRRVEVSHRDSNQAHGGLPRGGQAPVHPFRWKQGKLKLNLCGASAVAELGKGMKRLPEFQKSHPVVGLDTSLFIYHPEDHPRYAPMTEIIFHSRSPFSPSPWKSPEKPPT